MTAATLTEWRERFLAGGEASMKSREAGPEDEDKRRLKSVVATVSVKNELLREKIARLEEARWLAIGVTLRVNSWRKCGRCALHRTLRRTIRIGAPRSMGGPRGMMAMR